jgi:hypothetical protein
MKTDPSYRLHQKPQCGPHHREQFVLDIVCCSQGWGVQKRLKLGKFFWSWISSCIECLHVCRFVSEEIWSCYFRSTLLKWIVQVFTTNVTMFRLFKEIKWHDMSDNLYVFTSSHIVGTFFWGLIFLTKDLPVVRILSTQDNTHIYTAGTHRCPERNSEPRSIC